MGAVTFGFSMSLDGYIATPDEDFSRLFTWYSADDATNEVEMGDHSISVSAEGADFINEASQATGALVAGRKLFDVTNAWGGKHPLDVPVFVVTHRVAQEWVKEGSPFTFVTDGVASAIRQAQAVAGEKSIAAASASITQQCLNAGLLDEIHVDLVPYVLGAGTPLFAHLQVTPLDLEITDVTPGRGVTHLTFRIIT